MGGSLGMTIVIAVVIVIIIVIAIVSTITGKKAAKKEQKQRKKVVRDEIKKYIAKTENKKNIYIEYDKVYARKGPEYKYRDVFDVIVKMFDPKSQELISTKAYEIEGITKKVDKKTYNTSWAVNGEIELEETEKRIAIAEKRIKLTKEEKAALKKIEKEKKQEQAEKAKVEYKEAKAKQKEAKKNPNPEVDALIKKTTVKFKPTRHK